MFGNHLDRFLNKKISQVNVWQYAGRVLPLTALFVLGVMYLVDAEAFLDYFWIIVATSFASASFFWWWWVLNSVKDLVQNIKKADERFEVIVDEIKELKSEIVKTNASSRKRSKS